MHFENSRLKSVKDDPEFWITELEAIHHKMDEKGLMSFMSDDDFMLHIMGNLSKKYEAIGISFENRLMAESYEKLAIKLMHQKLNACFKRLQNKKEDNEEEEKVLAAINKQKKGINSLE